MGTSADFIDRLNQAYEKGIANCSEGPKAIKWVEEVIRTSKEMEEKRKAKAKNTEKNDPREQ